MKKTLVALAVMAVAGTANAGIELYNKDGVTVSMTGDVEVRYKQAIGKDQKLKQEIDDADFGFDTRYAIDDATQVGFYWEFSGVNSDQAKDDASVGDVYVGFYNDQFGTLKIGKLATQLDDSGAGEDYLFGPDSFIDAFGFSGDEAVRYDYDKGNLYFGLAAVQDKHKKKSLGTDGSFVDAKLGYRVSGFDITGFLGQAKHAGEFGKDSDGKALGTDGDKQTYASLRVTYTGFENISLKGAYYNWKSESKGSDAYTDGTFAASAKYTMNKWGFAVGGASTRFDSKRNADTLNSWYVNADYAIAPSTTVYAEIGDNSGKDTSLGYGVGIKAKF